MREGMTKLWLCLKTQMTRVRVKFLELGCHGLFLERQLEQTSSCNLVGVEEGPSLLERFMRKSLNLNPKTRKNRFLLRMMKMKS